VGRAFTHHIIHPGDFPAVVRELAAHHTKNFEKEDPKYLALLGTDN
jgi:hypothetical protein